MSDLTYCSDVYIDGKSLKQMTKVAGSLMIYGANKSQEDEPLGRDRLGRLMYPGDYVWPHRPDDPYWIPVWKEEDGRVAFDEGFGMAEHTTLPEFVTVDLAESPKRTNYERYFGDIELDKVHKAVYAICDEQPPVPDCANGCPFDRWGLYFDNGGLCRSEFIDWLLQEATV